VEGHGVVVVINQLLLGLGKDPERPGLVGEVLVHLALTHDPLGSLGVSFGKQGLPSNGSGADARQVDEQVVEATVRPRPVFGRAPVPPRGPGGRGHMHGGVRSLIGTRFVMGVFVREASRMMF
jgi:hypothetical protein